MKLVVDTNVLITFFWEKSVLHRLLYHHELFAPEFALEEINKYEKEIRQKIGLSVVSFKRIKTELATLAYFVSLSAYQQQIKKALKISPDKNDVDFFALALTLNLPLWSNDKKLKQQNKVLVYTTAELLEHPNYLKE